MSEIRLTERDYRIFKEIERWRVVLGRHVKELTGFSGQRACDRRLRKLIDTGFLARKNVLYGVPGIYHNTSKAKNIAGLPGRSDKVRIEQIGHDIMVLDTVIYMNQVKGVPFEVSYNSLCLLRIEVTGLFFFSLLGALRGHRGCLR